MRHEKSSKKKQRRALPRLSVTPLPNRSLLAPLGRLRAPASRKMSEVPVWSSRIPATQPYAVVAGCDARNATFSSNAPGISCFESAVRLVVRPNIAADRLLSVCCVRACVRACVRVLWEKSRDRAGRSHRWVVAIVFCLGPFRRLLLRGGRPVSRCSLVYRALRDRTAILQSLLEYAARWRILSLCPV